MNTYSGGDSAVILQFFLSPTVSLYQSCSYLNLVLVVIMKFLVTFMWFLSLCMYV